VYSVCFVCTVNTFRVLTFVFVFVFCQYISGVLNLVGYQSGRTSHLSSIMKIVLFCLIIGLAKLYSSVQINCTENESLLYIEQAFARDVSYIQRGSGGHCHVKFANSPKIQQFLICPCPPITCPKPLPCFSQTGTSISPMTAATAIEFVKNVANQTGTNNTFVKTVKAVEEFVQAAGETVKSVQYTGESAYKVYDSLKSAAEQDLPSWVVPTIVSLSGLVVVCAVTMVGLYFKTCNCCKSCVRHSTNETSGSAVENETGGSVTENETEMSFNPGNRSSPVNDFDSLMQISDSAFHSTLSS
jgi:hypothetical protein